MPLYVSPICLTSLVFLPSFGLTVPRRVPSVVPTGILVSYGVGVAGGDDDDMVIATAASALVVVVRDYILVIIISSSITPNNKASNVYNFTDTIEDEAYILESTLFD